MGYFEVNQRAGVRWNATKAFLRPVQERDNLQVWTGAHISRVLLAHRESEGSWDGSRRAVGIEVLPHGGGAPVQARLREGGEVILATGAIGTPQILQLSGIGPATLLQQHGIPVVHDLPGVGENLQDHLQIRAVFKVQGTTTLNTLANSWWGKARIGLEYAWRRSGPMSMAPSQLGAFTRSEIGRAHV